LPFSMEQSKQILLSLSASEVTNLKNGINLLRNKETGKAYILYKGEDYIKACKNLCKHQGGLFVKDIEDLDGRVVRCTKHNWKLDVSTMKYVNPPDSFCQDELVVIEQKENIGLEIVELNPPNPWDVDPRTPDNLQYGEVQVTYLTHACMELKLGDKIMFFDPWLTGPAFARGWWLLHEPPSDWLERLCKADLIYISHMHSDHLRLCTVRQVQPGRFYNSPSCPQFFWKAGEACKDSTVPVPVPVPVPNNVDENLRFMILMDGIHPEMDTCIIVDYKGHLILNTVDCTRPNGGILPRNVDLMMSDFAGGASGFPMTFSGGKFTEDWKAQFVKTERKKLLNYKAQLVKDLSPKVYCPFAGYFVEAHPSDKYIRETNLKNDPDELNTLIRKSKSDITTWTPKPGAVLDLARVLQDPSDSKATTDAPAGSKIYKDSWDFQSYLSVINASIDDEIFLHSLWIKEYYTWAGFKGYNLVIRMIETDDDFNPLPNGYDYLVNFLDLSFPKERPQYEHSYEEIKNRVGVMRHVVKCGLLWDDLYIGFQNRIKRDPDVYHHQFSN
uniref:Cytidine monophosphate-N-acetylneuraminic acid hydroxylase n=1 Tax=Latimeria chalumnae TaxID=7897 RepID=H2ZVX4_LATCH